MTRRDAEGAARHDPRATAVLRQIVLPAERVVVASHRHWASVAEPVATAALGFVVAAVLVTVVERGFQVDAGLLWWLALIPIGRALYRLFEWRLEWFVATDKRLLLTSGFVSRKVAMMPIVKVTDMSYTRTPLGRLLGYGRFVLESAGQDQAMRRIDWVAHPDATYRSICDTLFGGEVPVAGVKPRSVAGGRGGAVVAPRAEERSAAVGTGAGISAAPTGELPAVPPPPPPSFVPAATSGHDGAVSPPGPPARPAGAARGVPVEPAAWPASDSMPAGMLPPNLPRRGRFGLDLIRRRGRGPR